MGSLLLVAVTVQTGYDAFCADRCHGDVRGRPGDLGQILRSHVPCDQFDGVFGGFIVQDGIFVKGDFQHRLSGFDIDHRALGKLSYGAGDQNRAGLVGGGFEQGEFSGVFIDGDQIGTARRPDRKIGAVGRGDGAAEFKRTVIVLRDGQGGGRQLKSEG